VALKWPAAARTPETSSIVVEILTVTFTLLLSKLLCILSFSFNNLISYFLLAVLNGFSDYLTAKKSSAPLMSSSAFPIVVFKGLKS
jgi:hypothetical protein